MTDATFTFRVDETLKRRFAEAARAQDRSGAQLLRDFMRAYVEERAPEAPGHEAWFRQEVRRGIDAAEAGDLVSAEEVEAEARAWRDGMAGDR